MSTLDALIQGFTSLLNAQTLLLMLGGVCIGLVFGFLPGLGGTITLAILIPFTYGMEPSLGFAFLLGAHVSVVFGGSISGILFNVPGTAQNVAVCFEGFPMSQKGQASRAIACSGMGSLMGGFFGAIVLGLSLPIIRPIIMAVGPAEYFMMTLFGLTIISLLTAGSLRKGLMAAGVGMLFSFVGMDAITGAARFAYGYPLLFDGIDFVAVVLGLFAIPSMIELFGEGGSISKGSGDGSKNTSTMIEGVRDVFQNWWLVLRCAVLGTIIGAIPGVGGTTANIMAYGYARSSSKDPDSWGKGNPQGVLGPEAATSAKEGGALIPTVAFGIPGSEAMAILLGSFIMMGLTPGPDMITNELDVVFSLVFIILMANVMATLIGLACANPAQKLTAIPGGQMFPFIIIICAVGAFATHRRFMDIIIAFAFGFIGYFMKKLDFSRASFIIAMVLGPLTERYFHVSYRLYGPDFLLRRPIALGLFVLVIFTLVWPWIRAKRAGKKMEGSNI